MMINSSSVYHKEECSYNEVLTINCNVAYIAFAESGFLKQGYVIFIALRLFSHGSSWEEFREVIILFLTAGI